MTVVIAGMYGIIVLVVAMVRKIIDTKIRTLIKAYLVLHKGKKCNAKEIAEFINSNDFKMNQYALHPTRVSHMINAGRHCQTNMLYGVQREKIDGLNYYWVS